MITYVNDKLEPVQLTDPATFCELIYGKEAAGLLETDDRLDCDHLFDLLCDERVVLYGCSPADLFRSIGIEKTDVGTRQERNIFAAAFLIRSALNSKTSRLVVNESILFVSIQAQPGMFIVSRTVLPYETNPQLNAWVRKNTIDKMLLTL